MEIVPMQDNDIPGGRGTTAENNDESEKDRIEILHVLSFQTAL
ncbi:MAG: hypothetical protein U5N26_02585 [Candidatus Marinimicrobia bacterium]|nr:hypothetical protein [Candidatus Neomarinimicrobiota bacterium]